MERAGAGSGDSYISSGADASGTIPGSGGIPAFTVHRSRSAEIPVLIAVPHAGRCYTPQLEAKARKSLDEVRRLEDRLVDKLAELIAERTGATLLVAHAPRAMIDLNRGVEDMDWGMVQGPAPGGAPRPSRRARHGLGLVPRRLPVLGELWREPIRADEVEARVRQVHEPYHRQIETILRGLRRHWGAALLLDLHSMPPLSTKGQAAFPQFVVGDRFGASCDKTLSSAALDHFARSRTRATLNLPYAGGYALDRHGTGATGAGRGGLHAMQIEVCRSLYLDAAMQQLSSNSTAIVALLAGLVSDLAARVAGLGRAGTHPMAAE